jgi:7-dehydrocholesterol reductase
LLLFAPILIVMLWLVATRYDGSVLTLLNTASLKDILAAWPLPSLEAAKILAVFALWQLVLLLGLPGKKHLGPVTPSGDQPEYKLNGPLSFVLTHFAFLGASYGLGWFSPALIYDHFGELLMTLNSFAILFCLGLYFKGSYWPSSADSGRSGNPIFDFYWGTELHPRIGRVNLKQLTNCRISMTGWTVILVSFAAKDQQLHGAISSGMWVAVLLQIIYIFKFFIWESGYFGSLDIMHDRFGFYICWGVLTWVPSVYTISTLYLVGHPANLPTWLALAIFALGIFAIWANYDADAQRQRVRQTSGQTKVWGKAPVLITATYQTTDGKARQNLLLVSGWWGLARHFHYVLELTAAFAWTAPAGFSNVLPWFYFIFLTILLLDRSGRDDKRCAQKYGEFWNEYRSHVPYRVVPGVF